jgi:hypothetical protein
MEITDRRTKIEFAHSMKQSANWYPVASVIRVVPDNLNTHKVASWYEAFTAERATWHGDWSSTTRPSMAVGLYIAEIERAVLSNRCLSQRIPDKQSLRRHSLNWLAHILVFLRD